MPDMNLTIVALDAHPMNPGDLSWKRFRVFGTLNIYPRTNPDEIHQRAANADILLINKVKIEGSMMERLPKLKLIVVTATGYDNVDMKAAITLGIAVYNAKSYSSFSVAQHVFALILHFSNYVNLHNQSVRDNKWAFLTDFSYFLQPLQELNGLTLGLFGLGDIGQKVAKIGSAFGMKIIATKRNLKDNPLNYVSLLPFEELIQQSDILSLHAPLTEQTRNLFDIRVFEKMKSSAILINTARGAIINENDLVQALKNRVIRGAGLDVLSTEPPRPDHPLYNLDNCVITPHHAWATVSSRKQLMNISFNNIIAFQEGDDTNRIC